MVIEKERRNEEKLRIFNEELKSFQEHVDLKIYEKICNGSGSINMGLTFAFCH